MKNLFTKHDADYTIERIEKLTPETKALWGKMNVSQMLAHCNVSYDMAYTDKYTKPGSFKKFLLKMFVKNAVVGSKPYSKNGRTSPEFLISGDRDFKEEQAKLIDNIKKTQELGASHFNNRESHSFGPLSDSEWNIMFTKHLDHHLTQFDV